MLAYAMDIIKEQTDPTTGAKFDAIRVIDETFGDETWKPLGKGFAESLNALGQNYATAKLLANVVKKELTVQARNNEQKATLRKAIGQVLQCKILPSALCENNQFNPNYVKFRGIASEIVRNELRDL